MGLTSLFPIVVNCPGADGPALQFWFWEFIINLIGSIQNEVLK